MPTPPLIPKLKDIKLIEDCSKSTAQRYLRICAAALSKEATQKVTLSEYAQWRGLTLNEISTKYQTKK